MVKEILVKKKFHIQKQKYISTKKNRLIKKDDMKRRTKLAVISFILALTGLMPLGVNADPPGMPGSHGENGDAPPGGSSPIGGGLILFIGLSAAYGSKKFFQLKETEELF